VRKSKYIGYINGHGSEVVGSFGTKKPSGGYRTAFNIRCICGKEFSAIMQHFLSGATVSCGCVRQAQNLNITGQSFNNLTVLNMLPPVPSDVQKKQRALIKCFCGKDFVSEASAINTGRIRSCGCLVHKSMTLRRCKNSGITPTDKAWNWYFGTYWRGAKYRNLIFSLDMEQFKTICLQDCHYCGLSPSPKNKYRNDKAACQETINASTIYVSGVDRIDSAQGYHLANCVPCCTECNYHKGIYTTTQFQSWIDRINQHNLNKKGPNSEKFGP
jgi:hypothetical protein